MKKLKSLLSFLTGLFDDVNKVESRFSDSEIREIAVKQVRKKTGKHWVRHSHGSKINLEYKLLKKML